MKHLQELGANDPAISIQDVRGCLSEILAVDRAYIDNVVGLELHVNYLVTSRQMVECHTNYYGMHVMNVVDLLNTIFRRSKYRLQVRRDNGLVVGFDLVEVPESSSKEAAAICESSSVDPTGKRVVIEK